MEGQGQISEEVCDVDYDAETGEVLSDTSPLSGIASAMVDKPDYWRNSHSDALISNIGPEFMKAFLEVQREAGGIIEKDSSTAKDGKKKPYDYDYTSLAAVIAKIIGVMHDNSLVLQQYPGKIHGIAGSSKVLISEIHTRITHAETGQYQIAVSPIPLEPFSYKETDKDGNKTTKFTDLITAQSFGKSFTYGKRYALLSYWGIATADNDAISPLLEAMSQPEYEKIAEPVLNGLNACESVQDLKEWGERNSTVVRMMHHKASQIVVERFKELQESLPAIVAEDEAQLDLDDAITEKAPQ